MHYNNFFEYFLFSLPRIVSKSWLKSFCQNLVLKKLKKKHIRLTVRFKWWIISGLDSSSTRSFVLSKFDFCKPVSTWIVKSRKYVPLQSHCSLKIFRQNTSGYRFSRSENLAENLYHYLTTPNNETSQFLFGNTGNG